MAKYETIELTREGVLATLTFNRPERYNALNGRMGEELLDAVIEVQDDPEVRVLLLTGAGAAFHAGGDVKEFVRSGDGVHRFIGRLVVDFHAFVSHLVRMPKPVVSAVNGPAAGAGFSLAMAADVVVAREDAVFTAGYSAIGASPDGSLSFFLVRLVGLRRALELYLTNRVLSAAEARDWGLVTTVLPEAGFAEGAREIALNLGNGPTLAYGRAKALFHHSLNHELETQLELEARGLIATARTRDFHEGIRAFVEKRAPEFKGE